jgi:2-oxopent-4-enoate/cis-2-oxohex-4-enoate hydratase
MTLNLTTLADELYRALDDRTTVAPLTERHPKITIEDAYRISRQVFERRLADGHTLVGKKVGVTSKAVQDMLGVHQPDFGYLTATMQYEDGAEMPISQRLIQPRAEGEIAFRLAEDLAGPGITNADVLAATRAVHACFEVVDSRVESWRIKIQDTVADNASSGLFVLGTQATDPNDVDFEGCRMVVRKNGEFLSEGRGSAALGSPLTCVAWLANTFGEFGVPLRAGEIILSGSLVPLEPVAPGDWMEVEIEGIGSASVQFT